MDKVVHFEIPVDDWERAEKFYKNNFGWSMNEMKSPDAAGNNKFDYIMMHTAKTDDKGMVQDTGAINGGLFKRNKSQAPRIYIQVESIEDSIKKIENSGGKQIGAIGPIPNGRFVLFQDPEGNQVGMVDAKKMDMPKM